MESWQMPYLTLTVSFLVVLGGALWRFFGVEKELKAGVDFAVGQAAAQILQAVTELMAAEAERATEPAWGVHSVALGKAMDEDRERRARPVIQEQWRAAMTCSRLLARMRKLRKLEFIGKLFCLIGMIALVGYAVSILFWLSKDSRLLAPVTVLMCFAPFLGAVCVKIICEVVRGQIQSIQREIEEPWRA